MGTVRSTCKSGAPARENRHTSPVDAAAKRNYGHGRGAMAGAGGRRSGGGVVTLEDESASALLGRGVEAGFLTEEEISLALEELDLDPSQVDDLFKALEELDIDVLATAEAEVELDLAPGAPDVSTDSLQLFLKDIGKVPLLTAAQQVELSKRIERGDHGAKQQMVEANLRLVVSIAKNYRNQGLPCLA